MKINFIVLSTIVIVNFFLGMHLMAVNENESPLFILTTRSEKFVTKEFIEHLYVSSDKTRLAFYLDSTRLIVILDFAQKLTTKTFYIPYESSVRDEGVLKFKTIRWNKAKDKCDTFIAVFSCDEGEYIGEYIFSGNLREAKQDAIAKMTIWDVDKASDRFNYIYLDKKVFYISRKKQTICSSPGEAIEFQPKINQGEMLSSFDISNQMEFYYTICHTNNRSKLHRSSQSPGVFLVGGDNQEFYPHVSPDGDYIGYIERDQHHQWFYHCALPLTGTQGKIIRSKRNFEIDQNARLYEYDLMHYWESTLCFFRFSGVHYEKEPEEPLLNKVGLFFLDSKSGDLSIIETDKFAALNGNRIMKIAIDKPSESIKSEFLEGIKYKIFLVSDAIPFYWKKKKMYALLVTVETSIYKLAKKSEKYDGILIIDSTNIVPQMNR